MDLHTQENESFRRSLLHLNDLLTALSRECDRIKNDGFCFPGEVDALIELHEQLMIMLYDRLLVFMSKCPVQSDASAHYFGLKEMLMDLGIRLPDDLRR